MIDTPIFFFYIETMHDLLVFPRFQSIFSMTVWNTIDDRYSIFPLYRNEATFPALPLFQSIFSMTVIDRYFNFFFYIETMHNLLIFSRFQSILSVTVWNTIDDRYSNVVLYIEMVPHFLNFASFQSIFITEECHYIDDKCPNILVLLR